MARKSKGEKIRNKVGWIPRVITKKLNYAELENHMGILFKLHMHLNVLQNFTAIIALCAMMAAKNLSFSNWKMTISHGQIYAKLP